LPFVFVGRFQPALTKFSGLHTALVNRSSESIE
jgi:hypothetical protein